MGIDVAILKRQHLDTGWPLLAIHNDIWPKKCWLMCLCDEDVYQLSNWKSESTDISTIPSGTMRNELSQGCWPPRLALWSESLMKPVYSLVMLSVPADSGQMGLILDVHKDLTTSYAPFQHKKTHLTGYRNFHYKDKTVMRLPYLYNGNCCCCT